MKRGRLVPLNPLPYKSDLPSVRPSTSEGHLVGPTARPGVPTRCTGLLPLLSRQDVRDSGSSCYEDEPTVIRILPRRPYSPLSRESFGVGIVLPKEKGKGPRKVRSLIQKYDLTPTPQSYLYIFLVLRNHSPSGFYLKTETVHE